MLTLSFTRGSHPICRAPLLLPMLASPGEVTFGDVYGTWSEQGLAPALIGMDYYDAGVLTYTGDFPRSEAFRFWTGVDVRTGPWGFVLNLIPRERQDKDPYEPLGGVEVWRDEWLWAHRAFRKAP